MAVFVYNAITKLIENIDAGDITPRLFEVLSDLQKTFIELLKMKSMHLINMEENMKKLIQDRMTYQNIQPTDNEVDGTVTTKGTKKLMEQLQNIVKQKEE